MAKRFFSAQEGAGKEPTYLGTAFGASFQRFVIYPLPDLEPSFTQSAMSTVYCFIFINWHFTLTFILSRRWRGNLEVLSSAALHLHPHLHPLFSRERRLIISRSNACISCLSRTDRGHYARLYAQLSCPPSPPPSFFVEFPWQCQRGRWYEQRHAEC